MAANGEGAEKRERETWRDRERGGGVWGWGGGGYTRHHRVRDRDRDRDRDRQRERGQQSIQEGRYRSGYEGKKAGERWRDGAETQTSLRTHQHTVQATSPLKGTGPRCWLAVLPTAPVPAACPQPLFVLPTTPVCAAHKTCLYCQQPLYLMPAHNPCLRSPHTP